MTTYGGWKGWRDDPDTGNATLEPPTEEQAWEQVRAIVRVWIEWLRKSEERSDG